jgi:Ca2+-binding RTX toxin-like protein
MVAGTRVAERGLGGAAGFGEQTLPRSDDGSARQDWSAAFPAGLHYFGQTWAATDIWVNTNGTLSLGAPFADYPTAGNARPVAELIAPFWADVDTRLRGEGVESGEIHVDIDPQRGVVSVTWDGVGCFRRDTDPVNRFQVQLYDRGAGDFDLAFRYEAIGWVRGSADPDAGARAGLWSARIAQPLPAGPAQAEPAALATLDTDPGNTGVPGLWVWQFRGGTVSGVAAAGGLVLAGGPGADVLEGGAGDDVLTGAGGPDVLRGNAGADILRGGDGADTLNGGTGDDIIFGGDTAADLRDVIFGGDGADRIDAGHGNDLAYGGAGADTIDGGFGADELHGQDGPDVITGGAFSDLIYGGSGVDFLNGGFGHDRVNGGPGADRFYHLGIPDHGSDWVQDYSAGQGDRLVHGGQAVRGQFQVNLAHTTTPQGLRAGNPDVPEAFVIYRPTGQILWALVDGGGEAAIRLQLGDQVFDLLA